MKTLCTDRGGKFISIKLKVFCDKKDIVLKYTISYIHKENGLTERSWCTIVIMKDLLLLYSGLPLDFWVKVMETANYLQNRLLTKSQRRKLILEEV